MHPLLVAALLFLALACVLWVLWQLRPRRMAGVGPQLRECADVAAPREYREMTEAEFRAAMGVAPDDRRSTAELVRGALKSVGAPEPKWLRLVPAPHFGEMDHASTIDYPDNPTANDDPSGDQDAGSDSGSSGDSE